MLNKEFIPYELALELRELGFDEPCLAYYDNDGDFLGDISVNEDIGNLYRNSFLVMYNDFKYADVASPLFSQAFRWFREKGFLIDFSSHDKDIHEFYIRWSPNKSILSDTYATYEETELACLNKLIEIVKQK
jgi:hypothetical protein